MTPKVSEALSGIQLTMLKHSGEAALKNLQELRRAHGRVLERAVQIAGLSKKEAADTLGVETPSQLAAWFAGTENAQTWRFQQHPTLSSALLMAHAEAQAGATVKLLIEVERKVG